MARIRKTPVKTWQERALEATRGSQFGAILQCAIDLGNPDHPKRNAPAFVNRATVTRDGHVCCDFVDRDGRYRIGAFVGAFADLKQNIVGLSMHLKLSGAEIEEFNKVMGGWIATDYRSVAA